MIFRIFLTLIIFNFTLSAKDIVQMGIYYDGIFLSEKEAKVAVKIWNTQIDKEHSYEKDVNLNIYDDFNEMLQDYKNKKLSTIILNTFKYYTNKEELDSLTAREWVFTRKDEIFSKFYLIKNNQSKISLKNPKNLKVLYKEETAKNWAETIFYDNNIKNVKFEKIEKDYKLIFDVFFKDNLSIVRKELYDSMIELNPQIKSKIEILKESEQIFPMAIGLDRKNLYEENINIYNKIQRDINSKKVELESFKYINVKGLHTLKEGELEKLDSFYENYLKIR